MEKILELLKFNKNDADYSLKKFIAENRVVLEDFVRKRGLEINEANVEQMGSNYYILVKKSTSTNLFSKIELDKRAYDILNFYFEKAIEKIDEKDILDIKEKLINYMDEDYATYKFVLFLSNVESILIDKEKESIQKVQCILNMVENSISKREQLIDLITKYKSELNNSQNKLLLRDDRIYKIKKANEELQNNKSRYVGYYWQFEEIYQDDYQNHRYKFTKEEKRYASEVLELTKLTGSKFCFAVMIFRNQNNSEFLKIFSFTKNSSFNIFDKFIVLDAYENFYNAYKMKKNRTLKKKQTK